MKIVTSGQLQITRRAFASEFKAKFAIETLKGPRTTNELASGLDKHGRKYNAWNKQLLEGGNAARDPLYAHIGAFQAALNGPKFSRDAEEL